MLKVVDKDVISYELCWKYLTGMKRGYDIWPQCYGSFGP